MRTITTRWVLAVSTMMALSGCYTPGQGWSSPNLAFWRSSPFQPAQGATPSAVGSPEKPSGIAASGHGAPVGAYRRHQSQRHFACLDTARFDRQLRRAKHRLSHVWQQLFA